MILSETYWRIIGLNSGSAPPETDVEVELFPLASAQAFLRSLPDVWTFDIETYDAAEFPSRRRVATDPFHPDFRVRAVAIATSAERGALVDLGKLRPQDDPPGLDALREAFASDAVKGAFNGGFDENGLISAGWVTTVRNRSRDAMLSATALGDGTHAEGGMQLQHLVRILLPDKARHWDEDKGMMREIPIQHVARGAVTDACRTHQLCDLLDGLAADDRRIEWSKRKT